MRPNKKKSEVNIKFHISKIFLFRSFFLHVFIFFLYFYIYILEIHATSLVKFPQQATLFIIYVITMGMYIFYIMHIFCSNVPTLYTIDNLRLVP